MTQERDDGWDGGWERLVDDGNEFAEEVMMGPVHPYDRSDGYSPASRFATRHEIVSHRFDDPIGVLEEGHAPPAHRGTSSEGIRAPKGGGSQPTPKSGRRTGPSSPSASTPNSAKGKKAERIKRIADEVGVSPIELQTLRRRYSEAAHGTRKLDYSARLALIASRMGASPKLVARLEDAEKRANREASTNQVITPTSIRARPSSSFQALSGLKSGGKKKTAKGGTRPAMALLGSGPSRPPQSLYPPRASLCSACGRAVSVNGSCGCS